MLTFEDAYGDKAPEKPADEAAATEVKTTEAEVQVDPNAVPPAHATAGKEEETASTETAPVPTETEPKSDETASAEVPPEPKAEESSEEKKTEEATTSTETTEAKPDAESTEEKPAPEAAETPAATEEPASSGDDYDAFVDQAGLGSKTEAAAPTTEVEGSDDSPKTEEAPKADSEEGVEKPKAEKEGGEGPSYTEADFEAAAHAIATLESLKVNLKAAMSEAPGVKARIDNMARLTCSSLLKRFKLKNDSVTLESATDIGSLVDNTIHSISSIKASK